MPLDDLHKEFPRGAIHWRAQTVTKDGTKAMALAYLDARDVMDRLDNVCGPAGWQDEYEETPSGRVLCTIRVKVGDEWIGKTDGAGPTDVEAEKGGISSAFKRAAVKWGVGRYLYDMPAPWVPCETYERQGKKVWKKWTADPWSFVRGAKQATKEQTLAETRTRNGDLADAPPPVDAPKEHDPETRAVMLADGCQSQANYDDIAARFRKHWGDRLPRSVSAALDRARTRLAALEASGGVDPQAPPHEGEAA